MSMDSLTCYMKRTSLYMVRSTTGAIRSARAVWPHLFPSRFRAPSAKKVLRPQEPGSLCIGKDLGKRLGVAKGKELCDDFRMGGKQSNLVGCSPDPMAQGRRWVWTWRRAADALDRLWRAELRRLDLDPVHAIALLCGPADYTVEPRAPKPASGLVEQQRWFMLARGRTGGTP